MTRALPEQGRGDVRSAIIDAASRLLRTDGARAVTTRAVATAAGVQAPTIYRLFGDKDGLIDAVAEHVMALYVSEKTDAATRVDTDPVTEFREAWQAHIEFGVANADLFALLNTPGRGSRSPATTAGIEVLHARVRRIAAAGLLRVDEQRAVEVIHAAGTGTVLALLSSAPDERDPGLTDAMFEAVSGAILASAPVTHDTTVSAVTVMFLTLLPDLPALTDAERTLMAEWIARSLAHLREG